MPQETGCVFKQDFRGDCAPHKNKKDHFSPTSILVHHVQHDLLQGWETKRMDRGHLFMDFFRALQKTPFVYFTPVVFFAG
jgi:hypothetical protein